VMIQWLVQSANDIAAAPRDWLSLAEQAHYAALKSAKRRDDWLLGRWTAKQLLQRACDCEPRSIEILNDADGVPYMRHSWRVTHHTLSISHSHQLAFCAIGPPGSIGLGADIEHVEPRDAVFVEDYLTHDEIERVQAAPLANREMFITAMWSAKEAALKALHLGLSVDTRCVNCAIDPAIGPTTNWIEFEIQFIHDRVQHLRGWWRTWQGFILTLAVPAEE
jgi:4'-phosphopantetheinyl transferase